MDVQIALDTLQIVWILRLPGTYIQVPSSAAKAKTVNPVVAEASETMSLMAVTVNMIDNILILVVIAL